MRRCSRVPRPRRRGGVGSRLLGPRRPPRRAARRRAATAPWRRRSARGCAPRCPTTGGRRPRRHPAAAARASIPRNPVNRATRRRAGRAAAPGARHRPVRPGRARATPPRAHRGTGRRAGDLRGDGHTVTGALAVVGGNGLLGSRIGADAPELTVDDGTHAVVVRDLGDAYFLQRHGFGGYTPPHLVDHVANLRALVALGCDRVLAINSTGALHNEFRPARSCSPTTSSRSGARRACSPTNAGTACRRSTPRGAAGCSTRGTRPPRCRCTTAACTGR